MFQVATGRSPPMNWLLPLVCPITELNANEFAATNAQTRQSQEFMPDASAGDDFEDGEELSLLASEVEELDALMSRIRQGIKDSSSSFVPACRRMLSNARIYAATDTGLLSALHTFGKYSGLPSVRGKSTLTAHRRRGVQIGVQPTAVGRRKRTLSGKRKLSAGRPVGVASRRPSEPLATHDYTPMGSLPLRKPKAPHSLQQCVYKNTGLGGRKQAKM